MGNAYMEASQINYRGGEKKMSVEEALKNTSGEAAAIARLQQDVSDLNDVKANKITIAPAFSAEASYDPGDLVYYNGLTYRCVNAHSGEWDADDFAATTIDNELSELRSGLMSAAKVVYRNYHQIAANGNFTFSPTLEVNHTYLVAVNAGSTVNFGYCGIMLEGWEMYDAILSDIYKGNTVTVTIVDKDSIQVSNTNDNYSGDFEIVVIDFGRGYPN